MSKKRVTSAANLLAELSNDREHVKRQVDQEISLQKQNDILHEEQKQLLLDLSNVGITVESVWDLVNSTESYESALPILVEHLNESYSSKTKEGIIRALSVPLAQGIANQQLFDMFRNEQDNEMRWIIGNALSVIAVDKDLPELLALLSDPSHGESRDPLIHAVARIEGSESIPFLMSCLKDQELLAASIIALGNLKANIAKDAISSLTSHPNDWVKEQAKKALKKIG